MPHTLQADWVLWHDDGAAHELALYLREIDERHEGIKNAVFIVINYHARMFVSKWSRIFPSITYSLRIFSIQEGFFQGVENNL